MPNHLHGLALASALCVASVPALAAEETISFDVEGMKVVGTLNLPDGVNNPPAILLLHGFTGTRDELEIPAVGEGIFARAARMWAEKGIASLRIDYRFNGESDGDLADSTLHAHIADGLAALDWLARSGRVDDDRLALVGWSMGGAVGAAVAGRTEHDLDAVALWAPGVNMAASITMMFGPETVKKGLAGGDTPVTATLPWGDKIELKPAFFQSLFEVDPVAEITEYDDPLFVAVGTRDDVVFPQPASGQILLDYRDDDDDDATLFVREMDHVFNAFDGVEQVDELIGATGDFISKHLDD